MRVLTAIFTSACYASGSPLGIIVTALNIRALETKGFHGVGKADICSGQCLSCPASRDGSPQHNEIRVWFGNPSFPEPSFNMSTVDSAKFGKRTVGTARSTIFVIHYNN